MSTVAIILARGGSKRIPRKNIREFMGQPIIGYPIQAARESGIFDEVFVSTDDPEIRRVAEAFGARVPHLREQHADDKASTLAAVQYEVSWLREQGQPCDEVCCMYACTPFVKPDQLREAYDVFKTANATYVFPVIEYSPPIQRCLIRLEDKRIYMEKPEHMYSRSQDLEPRYYDAGQWYFGAGDAFLAGVDILGAGAASIVVSQNDVVDINTEEDWARAELIAALRD